MLKEYNLKDFLIASPYSIDTNLRGELSEDLFYSDYFIRSSTYDILNKNIGPILKPSTQLPTSIFLYGYSGTGKTTYLRWYAKNHIEEYNKIFFDLADVVSNDDLCYLGDHSYKGSLRLFDIYYYNLLCCIFHEHSSVFNELLSTLFKLQLTITNAFSTNFFNKLLEYIENTKNNNNYSNAFINLTSNCSYKDLLTLLLFFYYYYPTEFGEFFKIPINKNFPLLIIFDNIDHVEIEHHNSEFPKAIESAYQNIKRIILKRDDIKINTTIHFVFCLRDANCSIINRQLADITIRNKIEFIPLKEESEIFSKRFSIAKKFNVELNQDQSDFLNYVLEDEYTKKSFQPLFNFNIRKLAEFLGDLVQETDATYIKEIKDLSKKNSTRYGSRGIEYYLIINHLLKNDYLKQRLFLNDGSLIGGVNGGYVNPARIMLTNILNKSKYSLDDYTRNSNSNPIGLYNLFCSFNEIFEGKVRFYFEILADLFLFHKVNWCHLVTFYNKQVFTKDDFNEEIEILKQFPDIDVSCRQKLDTIKVRLNPAGFTYIRDITRHYEFFSLRAENKNPLFCSLDSKLMDNDIEFEFLSNINRTFKLTKECLENLAKFLEVGMVDNFSSSSHCFRVYNCNDEFDDDFFATQRPGLHIIRIIDTHISYIDTFRLFILNNNSYLNKIEMSNNKIIVKINRDIISVINQYISYLKRVNDGGEYTQNLICIFEKNVNDIIKSGYIDRITSLNKGRV